MMKLNFKMFGMRFECWKQVSVETFFSGLFDEQKIRKKNCIYLKFMKFNYENWIIYSIIYSTYPVLCVYGNTYGRLKSCLVHLLKNIFSHYYTS